MNKRRPGGGAPSSPKRARGGGGDDDDEMDEMDELIEMEEEMLAPENGPPEPEEGRLELKCLGKKDVEEASKSWRRPPLRTLDPAEPISFQQIEADYMVAPVVPEYRHPSAPQEVRAAVVRLYGVTDAGNSVLAHVHGFMPYFYVRAPPGFLPEHCEKFKAMLNAKLAGASREQVASRTTRAGPAEPQPRPTQRPQPARNTRAGDAADPRHRVRLAPVDHELQLQPAGHVPARRHRAALARPHLPPLPRAGPGAAAHRLLHF